MMLDALLLTGTRLAEALRAENMALAALDLPSAARLAEVKVQATDAFAAAYAATARTGTTVAEPARAATAALTRDLDTLAAENRRLLQRAIGIQSRVIETIAGAAMPRPTGGYGLAGRRTAPRTVPPLAVATRA